MLKNAAAMLPRYAADYRALLWCLAMPVFALAPYAQILTSTIARLTSSSDSPAFSMS